MLDKMMHAALVVLVVYLILSGSKECAGAAEAIITEQVEQVTVTATPATGELLAVTISNGEATMPLTVEQYAAISRIHTSRRYGLARIAWCESRFDAHAVGDGGYSFGAWQVQPRFWGPVPTTLEEQAEQADRIAAEHGLEPWTTRHGCEGWSR